MNSFCLNHKRDWVSKKSLYFEDEWRNFGFGSLYQDLGEKSIVETQKKKKTFVLNHYEELGERTCTTYWTMMNWAFFPTMNFFGCCVGWFRVQGWERGNNRTMDEKRANWEI